MMLCYCGSKLYYTQCCLPLHQGIVFATTPEQLMRSRFSAYCALQVDYIAATYHSSQHSPTQIAEIRSFATAVHFIGLDIKSAGVPSSDLPVTLAPLTEPMLTIHQVDAASMINQRKAITSEEVQQSAERVLHLSNPALLQKLTVSPEPTMAVETISKHNPPTSKGTAQYDYVHFVVRYLEGDRYQLLEENSRFVFEQGRWWYLDGKLTAHPATRLGRNESCPCGSGKKFKQCTAHRQAGS